MANVTTMHPAAAVAVRAANNETRWGHRNARQHARKHGAFRLFLLARLLRDGLV